MATTTNFGWETPNDTDLVKDGAAAMRTLGNSIDTSFVDLKGGTTGQVLAKASNSDMDFVWAADAGAPESYGFTAGKNKIINGDFGVWQRGTSFNPSATGFFLFADRWRSYTYAASATTATQQAFTPGTAPVAGYEGTYFGRVLSTNTFAYFSYNGIENVRTFAGQTVTLSYWAKSASAQTLNEVQIAQYFGSTGSAAVNTNLTPPSITTSWVRYTHTFTMPSVSGKTISGGNDAIFINIKGAINNALDIWGVQLEAGSSATAFQTATGSIQGELAACQRYYYRVTATQAYSDFGSGYNKTTTEGSFMIPFPVTMRTTPTALEQTGTASNYNILHASGGSPARAACSSVPSYQVATPTMGRVDFIVASGLTSGNGAIAGSNNNTTAYLGWSAEL